MATVPLSNIDQAPTRVGYQATVLLDRMMDGEPAPKTPVLIPPNGVVHRQSSDTTAVDDPLVADAVAFIRDHVCEPIQVIDLQQRLGLSRRVIEYPFRKYLVAVLQRRSAALARNVPVAYLLKPTCRLPRSRRWQVSTMPRYLFAPLR